MLIDTALGPMDSALLNRRVQRIENERELTERVEYWFEGVCVKSDVHIRLKQGLGIEGILQKC